MEHVGSKDEGESQSKIYYWVKILKSMYQIK